MFYYFIATSVQILLGDILFLIFLNIFIKTWLYNGVHKLKLLIYDFLVSYAFER